MGVWAKPRNVKWHDTDEERLAAIQAVFRCENRSQTVRTVIRFVSDVIAFGILQQVLAEIQELQYAHSVRTLVATRAGKPGPQHALFGRAGDAAFTYAWHGIARSESEARAFLTMLAQQVAA